MRVRTFPSLSARRSRSEPEKPAFLSPASGFGPLSCDTPEDMGAVDSDWLVSLTPTFTIDAQAIYKGREGGARDSCGPRSTYMGCMGAQGGQK